MLVESQKGSARAVHTSISKLFNSANFEAVVRTIIEL